MNYFDAIGKYKKQHTCMPLAFVNLNSFLYFSPFLRNKSIPSHTNRANLFLTTVEKQFSGGSTVFSTNGSGATHTNIHRQKNKQINKKLP